LKKKKKKKGEKKRKKERKKAGIISNSWYWISFAAVLELSFCLNLDTFLEDL